MMNCLKDVMFSGGWTRWWSRGRGRGPALLASVAAAAPLTAHAQADDSGESKSKPKRWKAEFLIVGGGTAGYTALKELAGVSQRYTIGKVLMVTEEPYTPYMRPPLSKQLWFSFSQPTSLSFVSENKQGKLRSIFYKENEYYDSLPDVELKSSSKVVDIDPIERTVLLENGEIIEYENCLLAPGGSPKMLSLFTESTDPEVKKRFSVFRNVEDFKKLQKTCRDCRRIAVIGGGYLGCELSIALAGQDSSGNKVVEQIIPESGYMGLVLPKFLSKWTGKQVSNLGVTLRENTRVSAVTVSNKEDSEEPCVELTLTNGEKLQVDHVIGAIGIHPNTNLSKSGLLEVDEQLGGYFVNSELQASYPGVWVAGDACSFYDPKLSARRRVEHHDHAVVSGRLAATNMLSHSSIKDSLPKELREPKSFWHQSMFWGDLGDSIGYEAIGIVDSALPVKAYFYKRDGSLGMVDSRDAADSAQTDVDLSKGVLFYLSDTPTKGDLRTVVGVVAWNVYGKIPNARNVVGNDFYENETDKLSKSFL